MKIGLVLPSIFASETLYPNRIFAPKDLFIDLVNGLVEKGVDVTVFAPYDVKTKAPTIGPSLDYFLNPVEYYKLRNIDKLEREIATKEVKKRNFELNCLVMAYDSLQKGQIDLLHVYHESFLFIAHYLENLVSRPVIYSLHDPLPIKDSFEYFELLKFKDHKFLALSKAMVVGDLNLNFVGTIHHGIQLGKFKFSQEADDYMLFIGRLVQEKGPDDAIHAAKKVKKKIKIAFSKDQDNQDYYNSQIKQQIDSTQVEDIGMLITPRREEIMGRAKCLLFPIKWEEPFGMVMIETMACGTPVVAYARGSVPEVIKDGETGFIVNSSDSDIRGDWIIKKTGIEGLTEAVNKIYSMSKEEYQVMRCACRAHVEANFTAEKMVDNYVKVYQKILAARK